MKRKLSLLFVSGLILLIAFPSSKSLAISGSESMDKHRKLGSAYLSNEDYGLARQEFAKMFEAMEREDVKKRRIFYATSLFSILSLWVGTRKLSRNKRIRMLKITMPTNVERDIILTLLIILLICMRLFFMPYAINNGELLYRGEIAKDIMDGLKSSVFDYQYAGYNGGILLTGVLAVPFFLLFGDTIFSFSLLPMAIAIMTLVLIYLFMLRFFDRDSAALAGFLFAAGMPFSFIQRSMFAFGDHIEMVLFILLAVYILFKIFSDPALMDAYYGFAGNAKARRKLTLLFGLFGIISGIALYACYSFIIALGICFIFWLFSDRRLFFKKYFFIFIFSFIAGFSPWFIYNITHNWQGFYLPGTGYPINILPALNIVPKKSLVDVINTLSGLNLELKNFFYLKPRDILPANIFYNILIFALPLVFALNIKNFRRQSGIILLLVCLYILAYGLHPDEWPKTYYIFPMLPLLFMLVAIFISGVFEIKRFYPLGYICGCLLSLLIVLYGCSNFRNILSEDIDKLPFGKVFGTKAYSMEGFETLVRMPTSIYMTDYADTLYMPDWDKEIFPESWRPSNFSDWRYEVKKDYQYISRISPPARYLIYIICGIEIGDGMGKLPDKSLHLFIQHYVEREYRHYIYEGIALSFTNRFFKEVEAAFRNGSIEETIPDEYRHYFYVEFGRRLGEKYKHNISKTISFIKEFSTDYQPYLYRGLVSSLRSDYLKSALQNRELLDNPALAGLLYRQWGRDTCWEYYPLYDRLRWGRNDIEGRIADVPDIYREIFVIGIVEEFFNIFMYDLRGGTLEGIAEEIVNIFKEADYYKYIYEGLGCGLSLKTYGHLKDYAIDVEKIVPQGYMDSFYRGYEIGLGFRFGKKDFFRNL